MADVELDSRISPHISTSVIRRGLEERLCEDFPDLFGQYSYSKGSYYVLHIACGDGWEPIIRRLSERITKIAETIIEFHQDSRGTEISAEMEDQKKAGGGSYVCRHCECIPGGQPAHGLSMTASYT